MQDTIALNGDWGLALDRTDVGLAERWAERAWPDPPPVALPGSLAVQRRGDPVGGQTEWTGTIFDRSYFSAPEYAPYRPPAPVKLPFWLTPDNVFVGVAWYRREIEIPAAWVGRRVTLFLERPHWETRVWLDDRTLGACASLAAPHEYELGVFSAPGLHRLTLRVDNRMIVGVGENAHSVSDHTQGNWNGIVGRIELRATATAWIDDLQVYPTVATRSIAVRGRVGALTGTALPAKVELTVGSPASRLLQEGEGRGAGEKAPGAMSRGVAPVAADGSFFAELALGAEAALWDEFSPVLHELEARLGDGEVRRVRFGLREVRREGRRWLLNGRPLFLRGALDCAIFPRTGHPPTDPAEWRRILGTVRAHGLNHVRFHSWCPPEAAFAVADELGLYLQVEASTWPNSVAVLAFNSPAGIGDGAAVDAWTLAEGERMLRAFGNHPSFLFMAAGNEPGGPHHRAYLARWVEAMRALDSRRLYTGMAGWPELEESDFHVLPEPRIHQWGDGLKCRLNGTAPATTADYRASVERRAVPLVSHEIGQWCAFPQVGAVARYTGHLRPGSLKIFGDWLAARGLADCAEAFVQASGRLQLLCYKEEIEAQLRTPGLGGFQLLGLQDFPGQGTAPVGVLDAFWESKPYATAAEFRRFCGPTVVLARLPQRVFAADETLVAALEVAHFGAEPLAGAVAWWRLEADNGEVLARGELAAHDVPVGAGNALGEVRVPLDAPAARRVRLVAGLAGTAVENDWDLWVYPAAGPVPPPAGVHVARTLDAEAEAVLQAGGRVVLTGGVGCARGDARGRVELGFTPIFWNTACTQRQAPHTLGLVCDPAHPALAGFPTEAHTNWQWWHLLARADALILDGLPGALRPLVGVIDDWYTSRRLGLVFEARVGRGRLLVCSIDLETDLAANPVVRQLRASLLAYAAGETFAPQDELGAEQVRALWAAS